MLLNWLNNASHQQLQQLWWVLCSTCGAFFLVSLFVQGGQTLLRQRDWTTLEKSLALKALDRKYEFTIGLLLLFCGALFLAFPRFSLVTLSIAGWLWLLLACSFFAQAIIFELRLKGSAWFSEETLAKALRLNGCVGPLLFGVLLGTFYTGAPFTLNAEQQVSGGALLHGLGALFSFFNLALGIALLFLARILGAMYLLARLDFAAATELAAKLRDLVWINFKRGLPFLLYVLAFFLAMDGYHVAESGVIDRVAWHHLLTLNNTPGLFLALLLGLALIFAAIYLSSKTAHIRAGYLAGPGMFLLGLVLLACAGFNNSVFYPSTSDLQAGLTLANSAATIEGLRHLTLLLFLTPFLLALVVLARKISRAIEQDYFLFPLKQFFLRRRATTKFSELAAWSTTALSIALVLWPPQIFTPVQAHGAALAIFVIGLWATSVTPPHLVAFALFLFCMLFKIVPAEVIFSGFASAALWLIFSGLVMGIAIQNTGLGERIAKKISALLITSRYPQLIAGVTAFGVLLSFIMPSAMGRIVLLIPIALALAESFGFQPGSNGRKGIILAATFGTGIPSMTILPANVPNMVMAGMAETICKIQLFYGEYLLLHFPILGLLKAALIAHLVVRFYPDEPTVHAAHSKAAGPWSRAEIKLAVVLSVLLILWAIDFLHHVSPAWVALAVCLVLLLPKYGLISSKEFNEKVNYGSLFFVAGVIGLGALVAHSGLGSLLAQGLMTVLPLRPDQPGLNYLSLAITSMLTGVATTVPGAPAVLTPLAADMAQAAGLPVKTILMSQVIGFSTIFFPYQAPPVVVGMVLAHENMNSAVKFSLVLAALTIGVLLPLNYLWWRLLGWL